MPSDSVDSYLVPGRILACRRCGRHELTFKAGSTDAEFFEGKSLVSDTRAESTREQKGVLVLDVSSLLRRTRFFPVVWDKEPSVSFDGAGVFGCDSLVMVFLICFASAGGCADSWFCCFSWFFFCLQSKRSSFLLKVLPKFSLSVSSILDDARLTSALCLLKTLRIKKGGKLKGQQKLPNARKTRDSDKVHAWKQGQASFPSVTFVN